MRGREFLGTCAVLASVSDEAASRTRTSRAYYAAYLEARAFCEDQLGYSRTKQSREHQDVPRLLHSIDRDVVSSLLLLRQLRNIADYDMDVSIGAVTGAVRQAESFAQAVIAALDAHAGRLEREPGDASAPATDPEEGTLS
ncbi:MAG: hypothetical protein ACTHQE_10625 [Thermomicrobiales bacterium]